jgi:hypothetical protein
MVTECYWPELAEIDQTTDGCRSLEALGCHPVFSMNVDGIPMVAPGKITW